MRFSPQFFLFLFAASLGLGGGAGLEAGLIGSGSGYAILDFLEQNGLEEVGKAEVRSGNNGLSGDWELGLFDFAVNPTAPVALKHKVYSAGQAMDYAFTFFDQGPGLNLEVGDTVLTAGYTGPEITHYAYWVKASPKDVNSSAETLFTDLGGGTYTGTSSGAWWVFEADAPFVQGELVFDWSGAYPNGSRLDFGVKLLHRNEIPEPADLGWLAVAGLGGFLFWRRRSPGKGPKESPAAAGQ